MRSHRQPARRAGRTVGVVAVVAVMTLALGPASALAQEPPFQRGLDRACVSEAQQADQFEDVAPGQTHAGAINCLWVYGVVQGQFVDGVNVYNPDDDVSRQQMASFVARMLMQLLDRDYELPDVGTEARFADSDAIASPHVRNVNLLHELGIARGFDDGTYGPTLSITRAQMASFIARAIEEVTGEQLPRADVFNDISGTHRANIEKLAAIGVVEGREPGIYAPDRSTTRAQMASFIARTMDYLVEQGVLMPMDFARAEAAASLGLTDVEFGVHAEDGFERVTFTLEGDDRPAGWFVRYTDTPGHPTTGDPVEVEGDAVLEVILVGMALPPELEEDLWDESPLEANGEFIVEVVDTTVFENRQTLFIGTTGVHAFEVNRLIDNAQQRVYVDVGDVG